MSIFLDLLRTASIVFPIFIVILAVAIPIVIFVTWLWDRFRSTKAAQGPLADWHDSYSEPPESDARQRMETLQRPTVAPRDPFAGDLLDFYQLSMEVDSTNGEVRLYDRRFFDLRNKCVVKTLAEVRGLSPEQAHTMLRRVRYSLNRRAKSQGLVQGKHRMGVSNV